VKSTPVVGDGKVYVTTADHIYALDAATGAEAWNASQAGTSSTPAVSGGTVTVGSFDGLHAYNASTGAPLWTFTAARVDVSPVIAGDVAYFGTNEKTGTVYAVDISTGAAVWSYALPDPGDGTYAAFYASSPAVSDGVLYIGAENNQLYAFGTETPGATVIWDGTVALADTTFTFVPSNNASASYQINRTTDLGALDAAATAGGFAFNASDSWYAAYGSFYLEDIDGIANEDWTQENARAWSIFINGAAAPAGLGANNLADGDELTFYYCPTDPVTWAPLIDQAAYVVSIDVDVAEAAVEAPSLDGGQRGGFVLAEVDAAAEENGWYVVVVSGTNAAGEGIAGTGTVCLSGGETVTVPVLVAVPAQVGAGTYTLYAGIYPLDDYPVGLISHSGGSECIVS
jgi:outer membrane protein assembly factor BamB